MWLIFSSVPSVQASVAIIQTAEIKDVEIEVNEKLECVDRFCYLGDMIGAGGGAEEASKSKGQNVLGPSFRELAPILTSRGASLVVKGKVYKVCVQRV